MKSLNARIYVWVLVGLILVLTPMTIKYFGVDYFIFSIKGMPTEYADSDLTPFVQDNKYGYRYRDTRFVMISPQFSSIMKFSDGLAAVNINHGKWGYIDKSARMVIQPQFSRVQSFNEGLAAVDVDGKCGYIDKAGHIVIQPQFKDVKPFSEGLAAVLIGDKWGYINNSGELVIAPRFGVAQPFINGQANVISQGSGEYIDKTGKMVGRSSSGQPVMEKSPVKPAKAAEWDFYVTVVIAEFWALAFCWWYCGKIRNDEEAREKFKPLWFILYLTLAPLSLFVKSRIASIPPGLIAFLVGSCAVIPLLAAFIIYKRLKPNVANIMIY